LPKDFQVRSSLAIVDYYLVEEILEGLKACVGLA
jgi:hypothetical protein